MISFEKLGDHYKVDEIKILLHQISDSVIGPDLDLG